jgi:hypothetical protein
MAPTPELVALTLDLAIKDDFLVSIHDLRSDINFFMRTTDPNTHLEAVIELKRDIYQYKKGDKALCAIQKSARDLI